MMDTLFITKDARLEREDSTLLVRVDGEPKRRIPIKSIQHVVVAGEAGLTTAVLALLGQNGVRVSILDWNGNVSGTFEPLGKPAAAVVRLAQAKHASTHDLRLNLARLIVEGSLSNITANLRYRSYRGNSSVLPAIAAISEMTKKITTAKTIEELMGYEGNCRAWYFDSWKLIDQRLDFGPRRRRPPNNPINCLISWFNALAYSATRNEISKTHLDDCLSFLHSPSEARHSLALDLSEPFKPAIVDTLIFELVLRDEIEDSWFNQEDGVCRLSEFGRKKTLEKWVVKLDVSADGKPSFRTLIRNEALAIERHVLGISSYLPFKRKV